MGMGTIQRRRGFTLIELLIVVSIILIILAIAIPHVDKQMRLAREMAVVREIGSVQVAEAQYRSQFGRYGTLAQLGPPASGTDSPEAANLIPKALADGKKNGYIYSVMPTADGYTVTAVPETPKADGRNFYSDQTLTIRNNWNPELATLTSPAIK
jgi:prepilin-type N-terminal cleavage/methylation domain-containing protein